MLSMLLDFADAPRAYAIALIYDVEARCFQRYAIYAAAALCALLCFAYACCLRPVAIRRRYIRYAAARCLLRCYVITAPLIAPCFAALCRHVIARRAGVTMRVDGTKHCLREREVREQRARRHARLTAVNTIRRAVFLRPLPR